MLNGKAFSILGDSISTYYKVSNDAGANISTYENPCYYYPPFPIEKTYWRRLADALGLSLCVNNSWSGGLLSGEDCPASGLNRAAQLANDLGEVPDIIIVFMGLNDLGWDIEPEVFAKDYERTLLYIKGRYKDASVCCVNLPDRTEKVKKATEIFNAAIESAVQKAGERFFIADLFNSALNNLDYRLNSLDGLHPDENGMKIIADVIESAIRRHFGI